VSTPNGIGNCSSAFVRRARVEHRIAANDSAASCSGAVHVHLIPPRADRESWRARFIARDLMTKLWFAVAGLFLAFGVRELHSDDSYSLPGFLLAGFFLALAMLTSNGFFADHRGGWPTYVGLVVAFFALFFLGCALGDTFWGTPPPGPAWVLVGLTCMIAVSALVVGAKRHRLALQSSGVSLSRGVER